MLRRGYDVTTKKKKTCMKENFSKGGATSSNRHNEKKAGWAQGQKQLSPIFNII